MLTGRGGKEEGWFSIPRGGGLGWAPYPAAMLHVKLTDQS